MRLWLPEQTDKTIQYELKQLKDDSAFSNAIYLLRNVKQTLYASTKYNAAQMHELYTGLLMGIDISPYADERYSAEQMKLIRWGILNGFDVSSYADSTISVEEMEIRYEKMKSDSQVLA